MAGCTNPRFIRVSLDCGSQLPLCDGNPAGWDFRAAGFGRGKAAAGCRSPRCRSGGPAPIAVAVNAIGRSFFPKNHPPTSRNPYAACFVPTSRPAIMADSNFSREDPRESQPHYQPNKPMSAQDPNWSEEDKAAYQRVMMELNSLRRRHPADKVVAHLGMYDVKKPVRMAAIKDWNAKNMA
jgi:hypothetical protein